MQADFPDYSEPLGPNDIFHFDCHSGVGCFTDCCRELELALTPYDVLRLKNVLGLSSREFLDRHAIIEFEQADRYPRVYLGMVDDGRASCPFVSKTGCLVYQDRPGACRTYPLARGASLQAKGDHALHVLLRETHCQGFSELKQQRLKDWQVDQELEVYNTHNDEMLAILNHPALASCPGLTPEQAEIFISSLYNLDIFRAKTKSENPAKTKGLDDAALLRYAIKWFIKTILPVAENCER